MIKKVSIVLTTHDGRLEFLKEALASVYKQNYQNCEIIVVDDASLDGTLGFMTQEALDRENVKYVRLGVNYGNDTLPKNTGIKAATGEYIAFLDSDNTYRPDHIQALVKVLDENPDVALTYGRRWILDETGQNQNGIGYTHEFSPGALLQRNYIDTSDVLVRREALFAVGGFDQRYKKYVDWNLWLRLEKYGYKFQMVSAILTNYRLHNNMKSAKKLDEKAFSVPAWNPLDLEVELPYLGEVRKPRVAIFSLTYDRLEYTKACFESLYETAGYEFDHFIVDNGSTDGTVEWLNTQLPSIAEGGFVQNIISPIFNSKNRGISIASNQALNSITDGIVKYDIIGKVDNDCLFLTPDWLAKIVELWQSQHMTAFSPYVQGLRDNPGGAPRLFYIPSFKGEPIGITRHLGGICHFVDAKAYDNFMWNEDDFLHGMQDLEFSEHLLRKGYAMGYLENYFVEHYKGTAGQEKDQPAYFERRKIEKTTKYEV